MADPAPSFDLPHTAWRNRPGVRTLPVKCLLCEDEAAVIVYAPHGCTCAPNKFQPRCYQHLMRAYDSNEVFEIVEDYIIHADHPQIDHVLRNLGMTSPKVENHEPG